MAATPRRSRRHLAQPLVPTTLLGDASADYTWATAPLGARPAVREDLPVDDDTESATPGTTTFYGAYTHDVARQVQKIKRAKKARGALPANTTYAPGDTVLVKSLSKEPSIAVITAMWSVSLLPSGEESSEDDDGGGGAKPRELMAVRLHWFTRPQELPRVRHKRAAAYVRRLALRPPYAIAHSRPARRTRYTTRSRAAPSSRPR
jgi:origin recognition complex subunit 1